MSGLNRIVAAAVATGLIASLSACGDKDPDPIPSGSDPTPTPTVSVSPPPDAPELNAEQQKDYDEAVKTTDELLDLGEDLGSNPRVTKDLAKHVARLTRDPQQQAFVDAVDKLIKAGAHTEGRLELAWRVPVKVTADTIELMECKTPGDWVFVDKDGKETRQEVNSISNVTLIKIEKWWYVSDIRNTSSTGETC